jgi:uncharacterized protein YbjQ (UPF0145 family)
MRKPTSMAVANITTAFELPGYRIVQNLGVVRGIMVRSASISSSFSAGLQAFAGGKVTAYIELCEQARGEAFELMVRQALELGANAIVGMRYDATDLSQGITEVLAYGTAVIVEPAN